MFYSTNAVCIHPNSPKVVQRVQMSNVGKEFWLEKKSGQKVLRNLGHLLDKKRHSTAPQVQFQITKSGLFSAV